VAQATYCRQEVLVSQPPMIQSLEPPRWLVVVQGIAGILFGLLLITAPGATSALVVQIIGLYWFVGGIIGLVSLAWDRDQWGWTAIRGLLGLVAGLVVIRHPLWSTVIVGASLIAIVGIIGICLGIAVIVRAMSQNGRWASSILGVADIVLGLILLFNALIGSIAIPFLLGAIAIFGGLAAIVVAIRWPSRPATSAGTGG
jgi:uncharacterized membrane protein HdeD (DUF308 family)